MVAPFSLPIKATRFSHSTASKGDFLPSVKWREKVRPSPAPAAALSTASAARIFPLSACFTVAISSLPRHRIPPSCGGTLLFYSRVGGHASLPSRSEEHTSELQSRSDLVCRLLLEKKNKYNNIYNTA